MYKLYHGDSYEKINDFQKEKLEVDHIITDPPYNISHVKNKGKTFYDGNTSIYFGDWDVDFDLISWIKPYGELIKKGGSFIIFCSVWYVSNIIAELEKNDFKVNDVLRWEKTNPMPRVTDRRYLQDYELAIWAVKKGEKWTFNLRDDELMLRPVFRYATYHGYDRFHTTQKPIQLMDRIIEIHTNENDLILDPFMGSGTTGISALRKNRRFIGVEQDDVYFKKTQERFKNLTVQTELLL